MMPTLIDFFSCTSLSFLYIDKMFSYDAPQSSLMDSLHVQKWKHWKKELGRVP